MTAIADAGTVRMLARVIGPSLGVGAVNPVGHRLNGRLQHLPGACLGSAQLGFELDLGLLRRGKIRRVRRQKQHLEQDAGQPTLNGPFTEEEQAWICGQWLTISHALQREMVAVLLPDDIFARLAVSSLMQGAREGALVYRVFNDNDAQLAATWLHQVE